MIKNIVFDLGNVLISFKPADYINKLGYTEEHKNLIIRDIFKSREWALLDNGDLTISEAIEIISAKSSLKHGEITSVFNLRIKIMSPVNTNIEMLPMLKKRGFRLYYLSNFPEDIFDEVCKKYLFFNIFDGGIISARVNASKPDKKIFEIFLEQYSLLAKECLFIDDHEPNVAAAVSIGMAAIYYPDNGDLKELIEKRLSQDL